MINTVPHRPLLYYLLFLSFLILPVSPAYAYTGTISDTFDGTTINSSLWTVFTENGPSVSQNDQLLVTIPGTSSGNWAGGVKSTYQLIGDFDIQVDFELLTWPASNGIRVGIRSIGGAVERIGAGGGFGELYLTDFSSQITSVPTSDLSGALRFVRSGNTLTGYYYSSSWQMLGSRTDASYGSDTYLELAAWSDQNFFGAKDALVAFDNFQVQYTGITPTPIPPTALLFGAGLLSLGLSSLRKKPTQG